MDDPPHRHLITHSIGIGFGHCFVARREGSSSVPSAKVTTATTIPSPDHPQAFWRKLSRSTSRRRSLIQRKKPKLEEHLKYLTSRPVQKDPIKKREGGFSGQESAATCGRYRVCGWGVRREARVALSRRPRCPGDLCAEHIDGDNHAISRVVTMTFYLQTPRTHPNKQSTTGAIPPIGIRTRIRIRAYSSASSPRPNPAEPPYPPP